MTVVHPDGLPELFLDRSLGRRQVPALLRAAGLRLHTLAEVYGIPADETVADTEWLTRAGQQGWVVLMKDDRIRYRPVERAAVLEHRVRAFCPRQRVQQSRRLLRADRGRRPGRRSPHDLGHRTRLSVPGTTVRQTNPSETVIRPGDRPVTLINIFEVDKSTQQELVAVLGEVTEQVMRHRPGFISVNLHTSLDGTRVVNYAQWRSREDFEATMANPDAQSHLRRGSAVARGTPHLYSVAVVHHA